MLKTRKITGLVLIALWCVGLLFGVFLSALDDSLSDALMRTVLTKRPAFFALLIKNCLPVILLYGIMLRSVFFLTYPLVFADAVCRGFCAMCVIAFLPDGAWLLRILLLFSSGCVSALIWYILFCCLQRGKQNAFPTVLIPFVFLFFITVLDYFCISPFLLNLSKYF